MAPLLLSTRYRSAVLGHALLCFAAQPVAAGVLGEAAEVQIPWLRLIGAFLVCCLLAAGAAAALYGRTHGRIDLKSTLATALGHIVRSADRSAERRLLVVETIRLNHQVDLCLVRYDDQDVVLSVTPQGAAVLPIKGGKIRSPAGM